MRILLLGEYSNVHHTLALGLRKLGHEVTVASDGDHWKSYERDVDLKRSGSGKLSGLRYYLRLRRMFRQFQGYDVVQLINAEFLPLKAERIGWFYRFLRQHNRKVVLGAFGMDYYYIKACLNKTTFRYSDFNMRDKERISDGNDRLKREWFLGAKGKLNRTIAEDADAIVPGLYEYAAAYEAEFPHPERLTSIPFPVIIPKGREKMQRTKGAPLKLFIGIQRARSVYKGTDIMLRAAQRILADCPGEVELIVAENVPFAQYREMLHSAEVILDQLYSYTPAMNALESMAQGLIVVGGGEAEHYQWLNEYELRPILNVQPYEESVYSVLLQLVKERDTFVPRIQQQTTLYLQRHHEYVKVARQYEQLYKRLLSE